MGLYLFDVTDLSNFRVFLLGLFAISCALSIFAQGMIAGEYRFKLSFIFLPKVDKTEQESIQKPTKSLHWRQVIMDFWRHKNFCAWIGTEMLLESQSNFNNYFCKTFMDRLVAGNGIDKATCDWLISMMRPVGALVSLAMFYTMRKIGYPKVYKILFLTNMICSAAMLLVADSTSVNLIVAFLIVYPTLTGSVLSAGFGLGIADMVMDMKYQHSSSGRLDELSLACMFMAANALFCKPIDSVLPIIAAQLMKYETNVQSKLFMRWSFHRSSIPAFNFCHRRTTIWSRKVPQNFAMN
jgi:hypothetical protein